MASFVFCSAPLRGHLDFGGYLDLATVLASEGNKVVWASGREVEGTIEAAGVPFFEASALTLPPAPLSGQWTSRTNELEERALRSMALWFDESKVVDAANKITQLAETVEADLIVAENCVPAAALAAEKLNTPLALVGYPHGALRRIPHDPELQSLLDLYYGRLNRIRRALSLPAQQPTDDTWTYSVSAVLHLCFFPWYWWYDEMLSKPPQARCLGGRRGGPTPETNSEGLLVFATTGTVYVEHSPLLELVSSAMERLPEITCVISCSQPPVSQPERLPPNVVWTKWVDYDSLFPFANLAVHHGGIGTTHAAIRNGTPQIAMPIAPDQPFHASRIEALGVGKRVNSDLSVADLTGAIRDLSEDHATAERAVQLQQAFLEEGGIAEAAAVLLDAARGDLPSVDVSKIPAISVFPHDYS